MAAYAWLRIEHDVVILPNLDDEIAQLESDHGPGGLKG